MHLREAEQILKIYHHHPTPFVFQVLKVIAATFPFLLMLFLFQETVSTKTYVIAHLIILFIFSLVITYLSLIYWLDKLIVTNQRIVHVDWKYLTSRDESDVMLNEIEDIQTEEKGVLSYFWVLDYGTLRLDTASSYLAMEFLNAPDPEGIRKFVYHVRNQP